jgi:hypothetical protein
MATGRLKRNQDFLKEKTSWAQSLYFAQGASIRHEKPNGARHADLQEPLSQTSHVIREKYARGRLNNCALRQSRLVRLDRARVEQ